MPMRFLLVRATRHSKERSFSTGIYRKLWKRRFFETAVTLLLSIRIYFCINTSVLLFYHSIINDSLSLLLLHRRSPRRSKHVQLPNSSHGQNVILTRRILRDARVEADDAADLLKGHGRDPKRLRRNEPADALAAGRGGEGAGVSV